MKLSAHLVTRDAGRASSGGSPLLGVCAGRSERGEIRPGRDYAARRGGKFFNMRSPARNIARSAGRDIIASTRHQISITLRRRRRRGRHRRRCVICLFNNATGLDSLFIRVARKMRQGAAEAPSSARERDVPAGVFTRLLINPSRLTIRSIPR